MNGQPSDVQQPDYRTFDIAGSHAQLGFALGLADPPFQKQFWWSPPPHPAFAAACRDAVHDVHPHVLDEFDAYADAQRLNVRTLWQQCCRVNLKARVRLPQEPWAVASSPDGLEGSTEGCSTFVHYLNCAQGQDQGQYAVIIGRNYDYLPQQMRRQRIRFAPDYGALASIGARGGVPCGRYDGLNTHGLFASLHVVMTSTPDEDDVKPGVPFHLIVRIALEICHTAREAAELVARLPHLSSLNYLIADTREAFVVEADPRRVRVIERGASDIGGTGPPPQRPCGPFEGLGVPDRDSIGRVLAATNHFRHPDMRSLQGSRASSNSACRLSFLSSPVRLSSASFEPCQFTDALLKQAEHIMADRTTPVCGTDGALTTLWSCVAELTTKRIRYAAGAPGVVPFEELSWTA